MLFTSGEKFDSSSIEFRLIHEYIIRNDIFEIQKSRWYAARKMDELAMQASSIRVKKEDIDKYLTTIEEQFTKICSLIDPFSTSENAKPSNISEVSTKATSKDKETYLDILGSAGGFSSLADLKRAMADLNKTIKEMNHANSRADAASNHE